MKKMILNDKTYPIIMHRLKQLCSKPFFTTHDWDMSPTSRHAFKQGYHIALGDGQTLIEKHQMFNNPPTYYEYSKFYSRPMIIIKVDENRAIILHQDDKIYFFGGTKIVIETHKNIKTMLGFGRRNSITLIQRNLSLSKYVINEYRDDERKIAENMARWESFNYDTIMSE